MEHYVKYLTYSLVYHGVCFSICCSSQTQETGVCGLLDIVSSQRIIEGYCPLSEAFIP